MKARIATNQAKFLGSMAVVLLASAWTLRFWQAWLFLALHSAWLTTAALYLAHKDPLLLERRMTQDERGEQEKDQRIIMATLRALGVATLVIAGLDHRFGWSSAPNVVVAIGSVLFVAGAAVVLAVFAQNTYTSSIIEVDAAQTVVTTGLYRVLRHPMYSGTLLMGLATPLVLASYWAALLVPAGWALLAARILSEERFLARTLRGYAEYMHRTRSRVVPGIW
jgi:protein-S-isoprenylcysteine O-methyltransferase Ste14